MMDVDNALTVYQDIQDGLIVLQIRMKGTRDEVRLLHQPLDKPHGSGAGDGHFVI